MPTESITLIASVLVIASVFAGVLAYYSIVAGDKKAK